MLKVYKTKILALLCAVLLIATVLAPSASAVTDYGKEVYGNCEYGHQCGAHTITTTPSGLKIAVNLVEGQKIPHSGYKITVTPLNGAGTSFAKVEFYIDGVLVYTGLPQSDGSASWFWDPSQFTGTQIKIVATDTSGGTATETFNVTVSDAETTGNTGGSTETPPADTQSGGLSKFVSRFFNAVVVAPASAAADAAKKIIKALPEPIVESFPYFLFLLILIEIFVLLLQTKRELKALSTLRKLADRERMLAAMKTTFMELVSHYLRTPLTLMQGGADGLKQEGVKTETVQAITEGSKRIHDIIEQAIAQTSSNPGVSTIGQTSQQTQGRLTRQQIALWLPIVFIGCLAAMFVYLANEVSKIQATTVSVLTQVIIYTILVVALYQVFRRLQLRKRDITAAQSILQHETDIQNVRDAIISSTADTLQQQIALLERAVTALPASSNNAKFIRQGLEKLKAVNNKFIIATHLKGGHSTEPLQQESLSGIYQTVYETLKDKAVAKHVAINFRQDGNLSVPNPKLLALVIQTILDNAIAYSPENASIEIAATEHHGATEVSIVDNGQGIPADKQQALFQPFYKAEGAETFNREGMGFSLYLDKLIMQYMGGDITIQSEVGKQTRAILNLPATV